MADQGFNIGHLVAEYHAEAVLPAFIKGKSSLSAKEAENLQGSGSILSI